MGTINSVILTDACFSYSVDIVKSFTNLNVGYELSLDFAVPYDYHFALAICSIFTLVFAYLADNYLGKYHLTVIGLFFSFISSLWYILYFTDLGKTGKDILILLSIFSLLIYVATSPIRNVMLLEQVKFKLVYLRRYIFYLVFARLIARGLSRIIIIAEPQELISQMTCTLAFLGTLTYFALFPCCLGAMLMFESMYFGISNKCALCFCRALGKLIYRNKNVSKPSIGAHRVRFSNTNNCQVKLSRCLLLTSGEKYCTISEVIPRYNLQHWLNKAKPKSNEFEISQTYEAYKIFPFLLFGAAFTYLNYFITGMTLLQNNIVQKNHFQLIDKIDVILLIITIQIVLLPIVEFGIFPFFSKFFQRDTYIFLIGYAILILSLCMAIFSQQLMLKNLVYIPTDGLLQIRVFNSIGKEIYIKSSVQNYTVPEYGFTLLKDVVYDKKDSILFSRNNSQKDFTPLQFNVSGVPIVSVLVTEENITTSNEAPTLYYRHKGAMESLIYVAVPFGLTAKCTFIDPVHGVTFSNKATEDRNVISVMPGEYKIAVDVESIGSHNSSEFISMKTDYLYAIFPFKRENVTDVAVYTLEKAIWISYTYLFPQIATMCLGNAIATVSFLKFIYLESPEKLRCSVFAFVFALNILFVSSHSISNLDDIISPLVMLTLSVFSIIFCLSASLQFPYRSFPYTAQ